MEYQSYLLIPIFGILAGIIVPVSVVWLYYEGKRETVLEISKNLNDPSKVRNYWAMNEKRTNRLSQRRGDNTFVGIGISLFGFVAMGNFFQAVGYLVATIGVWILIAGYLYPNTGKRTYRCCWWVRKKIKLGKNHKKLINNLEEFRKSAKLTQKGCQLRRKFQEKVLML